jgi:hypothetical protein
LLNSRDKLLAELFPDLNEEYNDWHLTSTDPCKLFGSSVKTRIQMLSSRSGSSVARQGLS